MLIIGLTGNIGSGKSTVSRYLESLGSTVIDADQVAREIVQPGSPALKEIVRVFGTRVLNSEGALDRKKMGSIVFTDPDARVKLNGITHPRIVEAIEKEKLKLNNLPGSRDKLLVIDAPLLIEAGLHKSVDEIWVVKVDDQKQIERLIERDGLSDEEAKKRVAAQMPQAEKLKYARRVIDNNGSPEETKRQIDRHLADSKKEHYQEADQI
ncbi:dephospho-CoA kinase [Pelotomaculum terephthalicicum JT]|uniref:dephospho-CoA kinase n=1 Tax=Pelotomaculum TaxID=191373 RepID=UPI0009CDDC63|nr:MULTISPECIES: dephospho-CoA kinase [Pelotomaculum]MCG9969383.1 dephospho-CoA kinase [Pelotomaculum terephthalicicum JT]OPX87598.1 MAG: Dephospho-CoA kinase [Pelotomaculum sp. PtaB.Bin117]OPY60670.1 MAG: Dephospho-CoA kinase [Pelotomaculum sp. PtaU1.Bin065]